MSRAPSSSTSWSAEAGGAAAPRAAGWRAALLLTAPHKLCFFWAAAQWAGAALWWAAAQGVAAAGTAWPWQLPAGLAHGLWFTLGPLPLFIAGFMFTAGPRWLRLPPVDARGLRLPVALFSAGWPIAVVGFHASLLLAAAGLGLAAGAWGALALRMLRLVGRSTEEDRLHAKALAAAAVTLWGGLAASAIALAMDDFQALHGILHVALWWGIALVFLVVSHRMLPFLGEGAWPRLDARWPNWPLLALGSVPAMQGAIALAGAWLQPVPGWRWGVAAHLALVAALSLRLSLRWIGTPPLRQPMVAMLLRPLLWWSAALVLGALAWLPALDAGWRARLGMAALHALTIGYLGGTMLAMVTRVSSTHGGRAQAIDRVARGLETVLQATAFVRVLAALWPAASGVLLAAAAAGWLAIAATWTLRHGRWLGQPRADGRPD